MPPTSSTKHVLQSDLVRVVWMENRLDLYRISPKPSSPARILIHPLDNGLFHMRVLVSPNRDSSIGPLNSSAILSKHLLGPVIRETAQSLHRFFTLHNSKIEHTPAEQIDTRRGIIREIVDIWRRSASVDVYYQGMFGLTGTVVPSSNSSRQSLVVPPSSSFSALQNNDPSTPKISTPKPLVAAEADSSSINKRGSRLIANGELIPVVTDSDRPRSSSDRRHRKDGKTRSTRSPKDSPSQDR